TLHDALPISPAAMARSMYSTDDPSRHKTTGGRDVQRYVRPLTERPRTASAPRQQGFANLRDDREIRIDDVGDLVLGGLPHERLRAALGQPVVGHQPSLELGRRVLKGFQHRARDAQYHDVRPGLETRPAARFLLHELDAE